MAIITTNTEITINSDSFQNKEHPIITLELTNRTFDGPNGYTVAIAGDSNSQMLTFQTPIEYDNIDLYGTFCILTYWTSWVDDSGKNSKGYIVLDGEESVNQNGENCLEYNWLLGLEQTARAGICKYTLTFYLPLDENFYYEYGIEIKEGMSFVKDGNGKWQFVYNPESNDKNQNGTIDIIEYPYYALSSNSGQFNITDPGMGEGGPLYIEGSIVTQILEDVNNLKIRADELEQEANELAQSSAAFSEDMEEFKIWYEQNAGSLMTQFIIDSFDSTNIVEEEEENNEL